MLKTLIVLILALPLSFGKPTTTTDVLTCDAPTNFVVASNSGGSVTLTWTNPYFSSNVKVYYQKQGDTSYSPVVSTSSSTHTFSGLQSGRTYNFYIYTQCDGLASDIIGITDIIAT